MIYSHVSSSQMINRFSIVPSLSPKQFFFQKDTPNKIISKLKFSSWYISKSFQEETQRKESKEKKRKKIKRQKYVIKSKVTFTNKRMFVTGKEK